MQPSIHVSAHRGESGSCALILTVLVRKSTPSPNMCQAYVGMSSQHFSGFSGRINGPVSWCGSTLALISWVSGIL